MSLPVVRSFIKKVEEAALGVQVIKGIKPDQQLVKVVNDQLIELMGGEKQELVEPKKGPQVNSYCLLLISNNRVTVSCLPCWYSSISHLAKHVSCLSCHLAVQFNITPGQAFVLSFTSSF